MITISVVAITAGNPSNLADYANNNNNTDIFTVVLAQQFQLLGSDYPVILISAIAAMLFRSNLGFNDAAYYKTYDLYNVFRYYWSCYCWWYLDGAFC